MKIGAVVRLGNDPAGGEAGGYPSFVQTQRLAGTMEEAGFDSIWLFDHLLYREPDQPTVGIWECWTMLSALAMTTRRVELGTLVLCAQFRNPAIMAKMAVTLDEISNGRLILGLGAGWNRPEFTAFGVPFDHRHDRFEESLQIIAPLLREGKVNFAGRFYQALDCELLPRGPRRHGPPILIGAFGPRMMDLAVRYGDVWNAGYHAGFESFAGTLRRFEDVRANAGRSASEVQASPLLKIGWPDLAAVPEFFEDQYISGTADDIAREFQKYARAGVAHIMCQYHPHTEEALDRLIAALHAYRQMEPAG